MSTYDSRLIAFPDRIPPDQDAEEANRERIRQAEIDALLAERIGLQQQRESTLARPREKLGLVVDAQGRDTGLRVKNVSAALHREEIDEGGPQD
jgi:hypothetical protein